MQSEAIRDETIRRRVGTPFTLAEWRATRYNIVRLPRTNRREWTHCAPFGQCEWCADATSDGFVPPIGAQSGHRIS